MIKYLVVDEQVSLIGPNQPMIGPIMSGARVVIKSAPGCWGPMITPEIIGGHEVSKPIAVEGSQPGDSLLVKVIDIKITSLAAMSGTDKPIQGRFMENGDAAAFAKCPNCGLVNPKTVVTGIGPQAIRCEACGAEAIPFECPSGYTVIFDKDRKFGLTVKQEVANQVAQSGHQFSALPAGSIQNPATIMAVANLVGIWTRLRPFIGNMGTSPAVTIPCVRNAKDSASRSIGANNKYGLKEEDLQKIPDCHLDCAEVREGSTIIYPVMIPGAGFYIGDLHAVQGDGEIAGHTIDVSGEITVEVTLLKGFNQDFTVLIPRIEDLPELAKPLSTNEKSLLESLSQLLDSPIEEEVLPIQVIGTGPGINNATEVALNRMCKLTGMDLGEVKNRCTIAGGAKISRMSGVVQLTMLTPVSILKRLGIENQIRETYQLI